jgi:hypothetical protein
LSILCTFIFLIILSHEVVIAQDKASGLKFSDELSILMGVANVSFTENKSTLTGPNISEAASGSISSLNALLHYRFKNDTPRSWFAQTNIPIMSGTTGNYLSAGGGIEFTWGEASAKSILKDSTTSLVVYPITRYFLGLETNIAYIAYLTETAKKSDTLLEIGGYGGLSRRLGKFCLRIQAGIDRGVGVNTSTMSMKALFGGTIFLD